MESEPIKAPFTADQVKALNDYQRGPWHPFTCGTVGCHETVTAQGQSFEMSTTLRATEAGWVCPKCDYTQDWAWQFMADPEFLKQFDYWKREVTDDAKGNKGSQSL